MAVKHGCHGLRGCSIGLTRDDPVTVVHNRLAVEAGVERNRGRSSRGSDRSVAPYHPWPPSEDEPEPALATPSPPTGALNAFLRGVERRGLVFAELQSGDAALGDAALAATLKAFTASAARVPFVEWPRRFWSMLLAAPALRGAASPPLQDGPLAVLAGLGSGPRAALLLRLVAGLSEGDAAAVLGISRPTYRMALHRALPRADDGRLDAELWRAMGGAAQQSIRAVPAGRVQWLADPQGIKADVRTSTVRGQARTERPRLAWAAMVTVALLTGLALAATWWWPGLFARSADEEGPRVRIETLSGESMPASRYDDALALLTHADLEQLLDAGQVEAPPLDPAFDAWLASELDLPDAMPDDDRAAD